MKRKFSKILGVGLTLALLASLLLTAAPVSAITPPSVVVAPTTISEANADYTISFRINEELVGVGPITGETVGTTDGSGDLTGTLANTPILADSVSMSDGTNTFTDDVNGVLTGAPAGSGTVDYVTGAFTITGGAASQSVTAAYTWNRDDSIVVTFPDGTVVADPLTSTVAITAWRTDVDGGGTLTEQTLTGTGAVDGQEVTITWSDDNTITTLGTVVVEFTDDITNPDTAGDYNLTVATSQEDAATSADYEITVPDIGVLPGIVQQFNAAEPDPVLMAQDTGDDAINNMVASAGVDYTIVVGPGEYEITGPLLLDDAGLTLISSAGADDTIIDASGVSGSNGIYIDAADVTVDGFTVEDAPATGMYLMDADDAIIQNNIVTFVDYYGIGIDISASATGVTVSGNEFNEYAIMGVNGSDATLSGNTFGECVNINGPLTGLTITGNIMVGSTGRAIDLMSGALTDVLIDGNTISEAAPNAINIRGVTVTNLQILNNDIINNEGVGIQIADGATTTPLSAIAIKFNTITGNDADNDGYGIQNDAADATIVDASFNWWGPDGASVGGTGTVITSPVLADTAEAVFSATDLKVGADSLNGKDTVGVAVSVDPSAGDINTIVLAEYTANPQEAIADAIAFYDVYVAGTGTWATADKATIKFYAGDENTEVYIWSADTLTWGAVTPVAFSTYGGYVWVTIEDPAMLAGTPFALVAVEPEAATLDNPTIISPEGGERDVPLTPAFSWTQIAAADAYYFELADNANFVLPLVKHEGDVSRLIVTAYAYAPGLDYSTAYYWRVKAVSGTIDAGDLLESVWVSAVFITMDEPVEPVEPADVILEPADIILEQPDIIITVPAETPITPTWIYVIIAVGAVLVIALLVLIVRTRRVA